MKWFRLYDELLDDPKTQQLPPGLFKTWINLLCVASRNNPRGELPGDTQIAFHLRLPETRVRELIEELTGLGLLDFDEDTKRYAPHNWNGRQRQSDNVSNRVQKHRESVSSNGNVTLHETLQSPIGNVSWNVTGNQLVTFPHVRATEAETDTEGLSLPAGAREAAVIGEDELVDRYERQDAVFDAFAGACKLKPRSPEYVNQKTHAMFVLSEADASGTLPDPETMRLMTGYVQAGWRAGGITTTPKLHKVLEAESEFTAWRQAWIDQGQPMADTAPDGTHIPDFLLLRRAPIAARNTANGTGRLHVPLRDNIVQTDEIEKF